MPGVKRHAVLFSLLMGGATALFSQQPPEFEVATIKVHNPSSDGGGPAIAGNHFTRSGNVKQLLIYAYDLKNYQVSGGPSWVAQPSVQGDYYDIEAVAEGTAPLTQSRARQMLQGLLTQRFHLKLHRETRDEPVYTLFVNKGGPKFKESAPDAVTWSQGAVTQSTVLSTFIKSSMDDLVRVLSGAADRPVLNQTQLTGLYDFKLEFARDPATAISESNASSIFTAVQEQLGLKLESRRAPVEILVIDSAERPTEN